MNTYLLTCLLTSVDICCGLCMQPSEKDAGDYVCVIKNDAGEISKKISVTKSKLCLYINATDECDFFYRATLCVSAIFALARCGVRPSVHPCVRPSHVGVLYPHG